MKKVKFKLLLILTVCFSGYFFFTNADKEEKNSELCNLIFANIEALAEGESGGGRVTCIGSGSIDCFGRSVAYMYSGYSLDDF